MKLDDTYFKKILTLVILAALIVLSFFLLKPILLSIIFGLILAFVFSPFYDWVYKKIKRKNLSALIICIILLLIIILPLIFLTPLFVEQSVRLYLSAQEMDLITPLKEIFPALFSSEQFSEQIVPVISSFITKTINSLMSSFSDIIFKLPNILLHLVLVFFTLFFVVRDKDKLLPYIKSLIPFSKDIEYKLIKSSEGITKSVLYGQIIIGIIQGLILGLGFFIFGIPNALLLTFFSVLAGIFPIIGPALIAIPVGIFLIIQGNTIALVGIIIFAIISSFVDNLLRPILVSRKSKLHPAVALIGMIGGYLFLGILGFILGPLILAYLIIFLELYRKKNIPSLIIQSDKQ